MIGFVWKSLIPTGAAPGPGAVENPTAENQEEPG